MEGNEEEIFHLSPIRYLLFGVSDTLLLLKLPPITAESWLKASHWSLLSYLPHIFRSPNKSSWAWAILEESEDEVKTMMMIMTRKTIVHYGNVMTSVIWTLWREQNWWCINNVDSTMQINHLANFYHVCHCLKALLFHFSCSNLKILLCFSVNGSLEKVSIC